MDREAWRAAIHGVTKSWTRLSNWTELNWTEELFVVIHIGFSQMPSFISILMITLFSLIWPTDIIHHMKRFSNIEPFLHSWMNSTFSWVAHLKNYYIVFVNILFRICISLLIDWLVYVFFLYNLRWIFMSLFLLPLWKEFGSTFLK